MTAAASWDRVCHAAVSMSADEASRVEALLETSPDDLEARVKLIGYFFLSDAPDAQARRNGHIHWLISHHPEVDLSGYGCIIEDMWPEAYAEGKRRWQAAVAERPNDTAVLKNASSFLFLFDPTLAEAMLRRGASLEPQSADWHDSLARLRLLAARDAGSDGDRLTLAREGLAEYENALGLEPSRLGRYGLQIRLAEAAYEAEEYARATEAAARVLAEAPDFEATFEYGNGIHRGHIVLGRVALANGDVAAARDHLAAAGATRGSPQLNSFGPDFTLAAALLARGERDAVVAYLDACKRFWDGTEGALESWKKRIERGETPSFQSCSEDAVDD
jgi:tetratricopeptide (TPR) repeat protein